MMDKITKHLFYLLVFLLPFWFLPLTVFPVALNKQVLLSVFVFLLFILWLLKAITSGKISFVWNKLCLAVLFLILVSAFSFAFSSSKMHSLWGMNIEPDTFFSFLLYGLVFFLSANLLKTFDISVNKVLSLFLASSAVLAAFFLIHSLWQFLPWDMAKVPGFNPFGSAQSLMIFLGGAFIILFALLFGENGQEKKRSACVLGYKVLFVLLFVLILLSNYWTVWLGLAFAMAIFIFVSLRKIKGAISQAQMKKLALPLIVLTVALVFVFVPVPIKNVLDMPLEISPSYESTINIAMETLKESPKNALLGSGPATFAYQHNLYRNQELNLTNFWQVRFLREWLFCQHY